MRETTALGAAIAAGLAAGVWRNFTELREINRASGSGGTVFEPRTGCREESARAFALWEKAVAMSRGWMGDDPRGAGELNPAASSSPSDNAGVDMSSDVNGLIVGGQYRVNTATATATAASTSKAMGEVRPLQVSLVGSTSADLEGADEEDLCLELRRVEILQRLRKVRRAKLGVL